MTALLFVLGAAIGSFLNVVSLRYNPEKFILGRHLFGRSACPACSTKLRWFELMPIFSFLLQSGRCRNCKTRLSLQYPLVEIASGLLFIFIPLRIENFYVFSAKISPILFNSLFFIWVLIFILLLLIFLIDLRTRIVPDEANVALFLLGAILILIYFFAPIDLNPAFLGPYALMFGFQHDFFSNRVVAVASAVALFGSLILLTKWRGMGMGDFKLAIPLSVVFGWPDALTIFGLSFITGSFFSLPLIALKGRTLKSSIPFTPFIALSSAIVFFFAKNIAEFYFGLANLFIS